MSKPLFFIRNSSGSVEFSTTDLREEYYRQLAEPQRVNDECDCTRCSRYIIDLWDNGELLVERARHDGDYTWYATSGLHALPDPGIFFVKR